MIKLGKDVIVIRALLFLQTDNSKKILFHHIHFHIFIYMTLYFNNLCWNKLLYAISLSLLFFESLKKLYPLSLFAYITFHFIYITMLTCTPVSYPYSLQILHTHYHSRLYWRLFNLLRYESQNRLQLLGAGLKLAANSHFKVGLKSCGGTHHEFVFSTLLVATKLWL